MNVQFSLNLHHKVAFEIPSKNNWSCYFYELHLTKSRRHTPPKNVVIKSIKERLGCLSITYLPTNILRCLSPPKKKLIASYTKKYQLCPNVGYNQLLRNLGITNSNHVYEVE